MTFVASWTAPKDPFRPGDTREQWFTSEAAAKKHAGWLTTSGYGANVKVRDAKV